MIILYTAYGPPSRLQLSRKTLGEVKPILAVLAFLGGVDPRPRLGGRVLDGELGLGTVSSICTLGRLRVHFDQHVLPRLCPIQRLKAVSAVENLCLACLLLT